MEMLLGIVITTLMLSMGIMLLLEFKRPDKKRKKKFIKAIKKVNKKYEKTLKRLTK